MLLETTLVRLLAAGRVGHGVVIVAFHVLTAPRVVGTPPSRLDGFLRRLGRDEAVTAAPFKSRRLACSTASRTWM
jgi:hypothetical protein